MMEKRAKQTWYIRSYSQSQSVARKLIELLLSFNISLEVITNIFCLLIIYYIIYIYIHVIYINLERIIFFEHIWQGVSKLYLYVNLLLIERSK